MKKIVFLGLILGVTLSGMAYVFDYVMGTKVYPIPDIPKPEKGVPFEDPNFHITITRVTDKDIDGYRDSGISNEYSKFDPQNSDGSYIILRGTSGRWYLYDAHTFQMLRQLSTPQYTDIEPRWDHQDPNTFYYVNKRTNFYQYNITDDSSILLHDFSNEYPEASTVHSVYEGDSSSDSKYWAFAIRTSSKTLAFVVYDKENDAIVGEMKNPEGGYDWVSMSMSGEKVVIGFYGGTTSYDRDFTNPVQLFHNVSHGDFAIDAEGNEVFVFQNTRTDWIEMSDIKTGKRTKLIPIDFSKGSIGLHFSGNNVKRPGWVMVNTSLRPGTWMDESFFMLELKENPKIWRVAHRHSPDAGYWGKTIGAITTDGLKHFFGSNWDNPGGRIEVYQLSLPETWWEDLGSTTSSTEVMVKVPNRFNLQQNYPNPFNPKTTINFSLPSNDFVDLSIFNSLGQRVATLIQGYQSSGWKTVSWEGVDDNGVRIPSGVYFYCLTSKQYSSTRKMILLQ